MISTFSRLRGLEYLCRRHHDAEIDHLVIVAAEHDADDVLADVVHIAFDRREQHLAGCRTLFVFDRHEGQEIGDRLLHDARRLHDLWQEHLAGAEQVADDIHAVHQRAFDDVQRLGRRKPRFLDIGVK